MKGNPKKLVPVFLVWGTKMKGPAVDNTAGLSLTAAGGNIVFALPL
ncbi:MAG: hypothetical protein ACOYEK_02895 [bacterium]